MLHGFSVVYLQQGSSGSWFQRKPHWLRAQPHQRTKTESDAATTWRSVLHVLHVGWRTFRSANPSNVTQNQKWNQIILFSIYQNEPGGNEAFGPKLKVTWSSLTVRACFSIQSHLLPSQIFYWTVCWLEIRNYNKKFCRCPTAAQNRRSWSQRTDSWWCRWQCWAKLFNEESRTLSKSVAEDQWNPAWLDEWNLNTVKHESVRLRPQQSGASQSEGKHLPLI